MSTYHFNLEKFHIHQTRAWHNDTDVVCLAVQVAGQMAKPHVVRIGDVNNGEHIVNLKVGPLKIADTDQVIITYQIVNSGHRGQAELDAGLTKGAETLASIVPQPLGDLASEIVDALAGLFTANCDGVVVAERIVLPPGKIHTLTTRNGSPHVFELTRAYHGTPTNKTGCNPSPSLYTVTWKMFRESGT
jgi:hypothetical protein